MANFFIPVAIGIGANLLLSLFAPKPPTQQKGKIEDTGVPDAEYGKNLSYPFGKVRKEGLTMMWGVPLKEVKNTETQGGKGSSGGQTTEVYTYFLTAAYPIAKKIGSVRRVWMNSILVYNSETNDEKSLKFIEYTTIYTGNQTTSSSVIQAKESNPIPAFTGMSFLVFNNYPIANYDGIGFPAIDIEVIGESGENPKIKNILKTICKLAGRTDDQIDVTDIPDDYQIQGFDLSYDGTSFADQLQELMRAFFIVVREPKDKIIFKRQEQSSDPVFISKSSFGSKKFGENPIDLNEKKLTHFRETPSAVTVSGLNALKNYEIITAVAKDPSDIHVNELSFQTKLIDIDVFFMDIASRILFLGKTQSKTFSKMFLLPAWENLKVGDIIFTDDNNNYHQELLQITKKVRGVNYLIEIEATRFQGVGYLPNIDIDIDFPPDDNNPRPYGRANAIPIECPIIDSRDTDIGIYIAIEGNSSFTKGALFYSDDNGSSYNFAVGNVSNSVTGTVLSFSPNFNNASPSFIDKLNWIRVSMNSGQLEPVTLETFLSGKQLGWFSTGEIIAFKNVTIVSNNPLTFDISYTIRGAKGTEPAISKHIVGEKFVLLTNYLVRLPLNLSDINREYLLKVVPNGLLETDIEEEVSHTITLEGLKPFSCAVTREKDNNDLTIIWYRRTRLNGRWIDYIDIAYAAGELDSYVVRIYNGTTVKREWSVASVRNVIYTEAQQIADWGSVQSAYTVRVFQNSSYPVPFKESLPTIV
ncbi:MAG: hypothetical protein ACKN9F_05550 [Methylomonas sp.]